MVTAITPCVLLRFYPRLLTCAGLAPSLGWCAPAPPPVGSGPCRPCAGVLFVLVFLCVFPAVGVGRWDRDVECCGPFLAQVFDIQFLHKRESDSLLSRRCLPKTLQGRFALTAALTPPP